MLVELAVATVRRAQPTPLQRVPFPLLRTCSDTLRPFSATQRNVCMHVAQHKKMPELSVPATWQASKVPCMQNDEHVDKEDDVYDGGGAGDGYASDGEAGEAGEAGETGDSEAGDSNAGDSDAGGSNAGDSDAGDSDAGEHVPWK